MMNFAKIDRTVTKYYPKLINKIIKKKHQQNHQRKKNIENHSLINQ